MNKDNLYEKEKRILFYFIGWFIVVFVIMLMGINNVFALETNFENLSVQGYNNNGNSLTTPGVFNCSAGSCGMEITANVNSYGGAWAVQSPIPLLKNHTYTLTLRIRNTAGVGISLSSKNRIAIGNSIDSVKYNYEVEDYWNILKSSQATGNYTLQFVFTPTGQATYLLIPFTTNRTITTSFMIDNIIIEDLGSEGVSQEEINNSLNNQTNTITGEIDDMEQNIIDSNKETQDVIKDQFQTCRPSKNLWPLSTSYTTATGNEYVLRDTPITIRPGTYTISFKNSSNTRVLFNFKDISGTSKEIYFENTYVQTVTFSNEQVLTAIYIYDRPSTISEIQFQSGTSATKFEEPGEEICTNRIDETNDKLDDLQGSLNDSNIDSSLDDAGGFFNNFSTSDHGGLSGIITSPLVAINQMLNKSCNPMTTNFKGKEISLPCGYQFWSKMGAIQDFLNLVLGGLLCYQIIIKLFKLIEKIKNPEDDRVEVMKL